MSNVRLIYGFEIRFKRFPSCMSNNQDKIRIVVADDHGVVRAGISRWLNQEVDMDVVGEARSGVEALRMIEKMEPHVVLSDIQMPDMSGLDLVKALREKHPSVCIVLMTVYKGWYVAKVLEAGGIGYLTKEAERAMFVLAVRWAAEGRWWLDPAELQEEMNRQRILNELGLTPTERQILSLIDQSNTEICAELGMKESTLRKTHFNNIFFKIQVNKRQEAIVWAQQMKLIDRRV